MEKICKMGLSQIPQGLKAFADKRDSLGLIHRPHLVGGENQLKKVVLCLTCEP